MSITEEQSGNKSSRLKADYFEVTVALGLCEFYDVKNPTLARDRNLLIRKLKLLKDGDLRVAEQEKRAKLAVFHITQELALLNGKDFPMKIDWVGRGWQKGESLSDIDLTLRSNKSIGVSLKSTRTGKGTQKNLGSAKLEKYLGLEIRKEVEMMWVQIRREMENLGGPLKKLSTTNKTNIRHAKYKFPVIQKIGESAGLPVQALAAKKSVILFNRSPIEKRRAFLDLIFGAKEKNPLLSVLVEGGTPSSQWNNYFPYSSSKNIKAVLQNRSDTKSYLIYVDGKPLIRVQASFTNSIGLSAFCERAFLA
jgi:hypothetical protein